MLLEECTTKSTKVRPDSHWNETRTHNKAHMFCLFLYQSRINPCFTLPYCFLPILFYLFNCITVYYSIFYSYWYLKFLVYWSFAYMSLNVQNIKDKSVMVLFSILVHPLSIHVWMSLSVTYLHENQSTLIEMQHIRWDAKGEKKKKTSCYVYIYVQ